MSDTAAVAAVLPGPITPPAPVPPDRELSVISLLRAYRTNILASWPRRAYEEWVLERPFVGRRRVLLNAPEAIRHVLVDAHDRYGRTPATLRMLRPLMGDGLLLSEGAAWRRQRRTLAPAFAPRATAALVPHMRSAAAEALDGLEDAARQGPVDLLAFAQGLALEIAGRAMFSLGMRRFGGELRDLLLRYGRSGGVHFLDLVLPPGIIAPHDIRRRRHGRRWMALVERIIGARQSAEPRADGTRDLLDLIQAARDPETGQGFTHAEVRDQVATMLLAGHETTALALFWSFVLLAQAPEWQECLASEAAALGPDAAPERLVRTRAVVDEALRLYPPAFAIARLARAPDLVGGVHLRPGDVVVVAPWVLHRHRGLWQAPEAFDPRRFLAPSPPPERFAYLPFGAGPRVCIGAQFAMAEAVLVLAALLRRFRLELATQRPVLPVAVLTTAPDHAPTFRLRPR
ncbi:MAG TPA: cytochrome P450 [Acetobacteraceae bacterium]|nr:cytochrome P450 [Acetobacteraceae bacterium]